MPNKINRSLKLKIATNAVLAFLVISIGTLSLAPKEDGITADGNYSEVYRSAQESDGVSLMFNVYWGTEEVYKILKTLEAFESKATFFIGGCWADDNVDCLREMYNQGHEIGNHGYFHKDHKNLSASQNEREISACNRFIELAIGYKPNLFAPPSGNYGNAMLSACGKLQMKTILWSKDTIDWRDKDSTLIYTRATKNVKGGDFILMHPMKETADALDDILKFYQENELKTYTVSENLSKKIEEKS